MAILQGGVYVSKTLDLIINTKKGYRTESFSGSNTRNIEEYILPEENDFIILSDLDEEGTLFVF